MKYSIFARSHTEAAALAEERGWEPGDWIDFILDIDEPIAMLRGVNAAA